MNKLVVILSILLSPFVLSAASPDAPVTPQEISVAGFIPLEDSGRQVYDFNSGWRFHLGDVSDGGAAGLDDSKWEVVSTPHTVQLMPAEASGCRNYQGVAWYRKHFTVPEEIAGKDVTLHFEGIMGKQKMRPRVAG